MILRHHHQQQRLCRRRRRHQLRKLPRRSQQFQLLLFLLFSIIISVVVVALQLSLLLTFGTLLDTVVDAFVVNGERIEFESTLEHREIIPFYYRFLSGYIVAPGSIDVGSLAFQEVSRVVVEDGGGGGRGTAVIGTRNCRYDDDHNDDEISCRYHHYQPSRRVILDEDTAVVIGVHSPPQQPQQQDDEERHQEDEEVHHTEFARIVQQQQQQQEYMIPSNTLSVVDIAILHVNSDCSGGPHECDYYEYGIGKEMKRGGVWLYCCGEQAIQERLCTNEQWGRLIFDEIKFTGVHRTITVSDDDIDNTNSNTTIPSFISDGMINVTVSGYYVVLIVNCNATRHAYTHIQGVSVWKSKYGYLPGNLFRIMFYYKIITIVYIVVGLWYGYAMKAYSNYYANDTASQYNMKIEKWILIVTYWGGIEMIGQCIDYNIWNKVGYRNITLVLVGKMIGVLKQGISRCVLVMVSLGWGVVRITLEPIIMIYIVCLGTIYIILSAIVETLVLSYEYEYKDVWSIFVLYDLYDHINKIKTFVRTLDVVFIAWIVHELGHTIRYLRTINHQSRKMNRYIQLRYLLVVFVLFVVMVLVYASIDLIDDDRFLLEERTVTTEIIYLFVLIGVAFLWRPNNNARDYEHITELQLGIIERDYGLELSDIVPSATDENDEDGDTEVADHRNNNSNTSPSVHREEFHGNYHDGPDSRGPDRFQIS